MIWRREGLRCKQRGLEDGGDDTEIQEMVGSIEKIDEQCENLRFVRRERGTKVEAEFNTLRE
jgi:hypothetical protein